MSTHHEQATPGKAGEPPAHKFPEPSLYPVTHHRRANRTADYKAYLRLGVLGYRTNSKQHMYRQGRRSGPSARAHYTLELLRASHPRPLRQHDPSCETDAADSDARSLTGVGSARALRLRAARGPCGGERPARHGQRGCASAHGSRGPSPADGYSAGTYACSLELQGRSGRQCLNASMKADKPCVALPGYKRPPPT
jgi:hypothetical protein